MKTKQVVLASIFVIVSSISVLCLPLSGMHYPDYNKDQKTDLTDAIIALKTIAGFFDDISKSVFSFHVMDTSGSDQHYVPVTVVYTFDEGQIQPDTRLIARLDHQKRSDTRPFPTLIPNISMG